ncbi:lipocalin family protein [Nitrincola schmidtii]|uniref:lipocalin family protein n=1 Tax=Nitrincola schmidtii TaxID=1730894 RepID=UPI00124CB213|nr:lipocalin family protein [Nitrincola schmidtii]
MKKLIALVFTLALSGCSAMPDAVKPVSNFELNRYLGTWYEIARLDHSFERGLSQVTAEYSLRNDGGVRVINRGFDQVKDQWKEAEGRAYFVDTDDKGFLKVSFFGPFYGSYVIFELDEASQYAFISGPTTKYLWLLARTPNIDADIIEKFERMSAERGFDIDNLIYVEHD